MKMLISGVFSYIKRWLITGVKLQLFLTIATLPFIVGWGLAYSPLSIIGNLVFPLFLILFLAISSFFYTALILHLPTSALSYCLTKVHHVWHSCLSTPLFLWWPCIQWQHLLPAGCIAALFCIPFFSTSDHLKRVYILSLSIIGSYYFVLTIPTHTQFITTQLTREPWTLSFHTAAHHTVIMSDYGYIGRASNTEAVIDYEVVPHLIRIFGHPHTVILEGDRIGVRMQRAQKLLKQWGFNAVVRKRTESRAHVYTQKLHS